MRKSDSLALAVLVLVCLTVPQALAEDFDPLLVAKSQTSEGGYTVPDSYYNSLKGSGADSFHPTDPTDQSHPTDQFEPPLAEETGGSNATYMLTQIGELKAEIAELKRKLNKDTTGKVAGYDGSFFLQDPEGKFRLNINGRMQMRYSLIIAEDRGTPEEDAGHTFQIRRAFLMFHGYAFTKKASYFFLLMPQIATSLVFFDLAYEFHPAAALHGALDSILFTAEGSDSSGKLTFVSKSLLANRYDIGGSIGVYLSGAIKWFSYYAGVFNGLDTGLGANVNNEMTYAARVDFSVLGEMSSGQGDLAHSEKPALRFGAGAIWGYYETGQQDRVLLGTADVRFKYRGFAFLAGGVYRQTDPGVFDRAQHDTGFMAQASYFVIPKKLELGLRTAALIDDMTNANVNINMGAGNITRLGGNLSGGDVDGDSDNEWEYTAGLSWYFSGFNAKVQAQYTLMIDGVPGPDDLVNHIGLVQVQLGF